MQTERPSPPEIGHTVFDIRGRLAIADYLALMKVARFSAVEHVYGAATALGFVLVGIAVGSLISLWLAPWLLGGRPSRATLEYLIGGGAVLGFLLSFVFNRTYARSMFGGQPVGASDTRILVSENGIFVGSGDVWTSVPWSAATRLIETRDHVFVFFSRLMGIIIPKAWFPAPEGVARFLEYVRPRARNGGADVETRR